MNYLLSRQLQINNFDQRDDDAGKDKKKAKGAAAAGKGTPTKGKGTPTKGARK